MPESNEKYIHNFIYHRTVPVNENESLPVSLCVNSRSYHAAECRIMYRNHGDQYRCRQLSVISERDQFEQRSIIARLSKANTEKASSPCDNAESYHLTPCLGY